MKWKTNIYNGGRLAKQKLLAAIIYIFIYNLHRTFQIICLSNVEGLSNKKWFHLEFWAQEIVVYRIFHQRRRKEKLIQSKNLEIGDFYVDHDFVQLGTESTDQKKPHYNHQEFKKKKKKPCYKVNSICKWIVF